MAKMLSIRLDFPVSGLSISHDEILVMMQDAFIHVATASKHVGRQEAARVLAAAVVDAETGYFDDQYGSPVFYIP